MYEKTFPNKRFKYTLQFLNKHIDTSKSILDLGVKNPFSEIMKTDGYVVKNTLGEDLDEDQSGDIDCNEFCEKITTENLAKRSEKFTISKTLFIEKMLTAWSFFKDRERRSLIEKNQIFNHKSQNTLDLGIFSETLLQLEPSLSENQIL